MSEVLCANEPVPTPDERTMATLCHVLQFVGGWIAPLVIFLLKRNSRFVSFHALQVLLLQGLYFFFSMVLVGGVFILGISSFASHPSGIRHDLPPEFLFFFLAFWLFSMGWFVLILVLAIMYGIKAGRGEWAEYPVLGRLARRILGIGPRGESLP